MYLRARDAKWPSRLDTGRGRLAVLEARTRPEGASSGTGLAPAPRRRSPWSSGRALLREEGGLCAHVQGSGSRCALCSWRAWGQVQTGAWGRDTEGVWPCRCGSSVPPTPPHFTLLLYILTFFFSLNIFLGRLYFHPCPARLGFFFNTCVLHQAVKPPRGVTHSSGSSKPGVCREHSDRDNRARALQAARKRPPQPGPVGVAPFGLVPQFMKC